MKKREIPLMVDDKQYLDSVREVVFEKTGTGLYFDNSFQACRARRLIEIVDYMNNYFTGYSGGIFGEKLAPGTPDPRD